jgi:glutamate-5-semialdehyde dehydrogenase
MTFNLEQLGRRARAAARSLALTATARKNEALEAIAGALIDHQAGILEANAADLQAAREAGLSTALLDRMALSPERLAAIAADTRAVMGLDDPVGERFDQVLLPNGLRVHKRRTPLGVVGVIYEARPNVTVDVAALCLKAGSAVILRGGSEIRRSVAAITEAIAAGVARAGLSADVVQSITDPDRELVRALLRLDSYVDMIIPRGGAGLHRFCRENATIPVITGGIGVCHAFVDATANLEQAVPIIYNAKVQRPSVCNALDTLLVERAAAARLLPLVAAALCPAGVELRADAEALAILRGAPHSGAWQVTPAGPGDFGTEFLALVLSVRVVEGLPQALDHIATHSTGHSEVILTQNAAAADAFVDAVDSAYVAVNASTRFNDGAQLGLGAEIAISTQKLHARGPMALRELTTYKWVAEGSGQVRA